MLKSWLGGIGFGFTGAEVSAKLLGWRGMTVGDGGSGSLAALLACTGMSGWAVRGSKRTFAAGVVVGGVVHTMAAIWRRRELSPHAFFTPGSRSRYRVERVMLPLEDGDLPGVLFDPFGSSKAMLLIHGAGASKTWYTWPLIEGLLSGGYAVLSIDLDGHGENKRTLNFPQLLDNPRAAVGALRERYTTVGVIGISLGGCVAAQVVADGLAVDCVILISAPIHVTYNAAVRRREYLTALQPATWNLHRHAGTLPLVAMWGEPAGTHAIGIFDLIDLLDLEGSVRTIRCPLLLIYASLDLIAPASQGKQLARVAPGAELVVIPGATHLSVSLDWRTSRVAVRWLDQVTAPKAVL